MTTALVTGGGSGIGAAVARRLSADGLDVVVTDASLAAAEAVAAELGAQRAAARRARRAAGGSRDGGHRRPDQRRRDRLDDERARDALEVWENVFAVNARGTFLCCKHAIPGMVARGGGSIVNVASVAALVGLRNRAAYSASKGAVVALTRALAIDHVGDGIRVNAVCPGTVDSPWVRRLVEEAGESLDALRARQPMGRLGTPEEIAESVAYLASERAAFVTGSVLVIDGGLTAA